MKILHKYRSQIDWTIVFLSAFVFGWLALFGAGNLIVRYSDQAITNDGQSSVFSAFTLGRACHDETR